MSRFNQTHLHGKPFIEFELPKGLSKAKAFQNIETCPICTKVLTVPTPRMTIREILHIERHIQRTASKAEREPTTI